MSNCDTPTTVGLSEWLGPLPEPEGELWELRTPRGKPPFRYYTQEQVRDMLSAEREAWTKALDAEMVSCHLGVFNAEDDHRGAIAKLLAWHQDVALDPAVSSRAQELILKERERCAVAAWNHYMDTCRKNGIAPTIRREWCASDAIRRA